MQSTVPIGSVSCFCFAKVPVNLGRFAHSFLVDILDSLSEFLTNLGKSSSSGVRVKMWIKIHKNECHRVILKSFKETCSKAQKWEFNGTVCTRFAQTCLAHFAIFAGPNLDICVALDLPFQFTQSKKSDGNIHVTMLKNPMMSFACRLCRTLPSGSIGSSNRLTIRGTCNNKMPSILHVQS